MDKLVFAQSVGRIRAMENKLLSKSKLDALVDATGFSECISMLSDSNYGEYLSMPSYEEGLKIAVQDLYKDMYKISPVPEVVSLLALKYDAHNIKCLIKSDILNSDVNGILIDAGMMPAENLKKMIKEKNFKNMPEILSKGISKAYEDYNQMHMPNDIDIDIDRATFEYMLEISKKSNLEYLVEFTKVIIDITNIMSFIRFKNREMDFISYKNVFLYDGNINYDVFMSFSSEPLDAFANKIFYTNYYKWSGEGLAEYIKTLDLSELEKFKDNFIINYIKKARYVSFGPEPIIAYIIAVENEIKMLRIILTGKSNDVLPNSIRKRLRDVYV